MQRYLFCIGLALLAACSKPEPAGPQPHGTYGQWQVMKSAAVGKQPALCYAGTTPTQTAGSASTAKRGRPYLMVTRKPSGKLEVSASSGYPYLSYGSVDLVIDGKVHPLIFKDDIAWARGDSEDTAIIDAVKSGTVIEVRGVSRDHTTSVDSYSSHGFWQALAGVRQLCP